MMALVLVLVVLAAGAIYLGAIGAAFATLMRLSLRLVAERGARSSRLGVYLDDPVRLFLPVRAMLGALHVAATMCLVRIIGIDNIQQMVLVLAAAAAFVVAFEHLIPYLLVRHDPERILDALLPSFDRLSVLARPLVAPLGIVLASRRDRPAPAHQEGSEEEQQEATSAYLDAGEQEGLIEGDERRLLQSVVDFGDTLVREVMTPRPDIVAIRADATQGELLAFFREQEYSRIPVYAESLDNIVGFVFVKDLLRLPEGEAGDGPASSVMRPAHVVPETKRVSDLLREFQRQQFQMAIVVDEYGGTAGLVTLEDLLEEIVGEIRDETDIETEAVVDEGNGVLLVTGKADIETVADRLGLQIEPEGFETFGGYLLANLGRVPGVGERFEVGALTVEVLDAERRRIHRVRVRRTADTGGGPSRGATPGGGGQERP